MRQELLTSAVSFLSSEKVKSADKEKKIQFLQQKGLTEEEINEAFRRVEEGTNQPQNMPLAPVLPPKPQSLYQSVQIVYVPPTPIPRMSLQQIVHYTAVIGIGAFGITVIFTNIIKKIMSRILNSIAQYQRNRYNDHTRLLSRMESTLKDFSSETNHTIENEQAQLSKSLDNLLETVQNSKRTHSTYKDYLSTISRFKNTLENNPLISSTSNAYSFGSYSGFSNAYADRYSVNSEFSAIIQNIKSDIRSFKGALLSRKNFPTAQSLLAPSNSFVPPPPTPVDPNAHHPRNRASFRNELSNNNNNNQPTQ